MLGRVPHSFAFCANEWDRLRARKNSGSSHATIEFDWGSFEACSSTRTALEAAPNQFSALFELRKSLFRKILAISPLNSKILGLLACNSMILIGRGRGRVPQ